MTKPTKKGRKSGRFAASIEEWSEQHGVPVLVADYQVTRRQRIHTVAFPDGQPPFTARKIVDCIEGVGVEGYEKVVIAYIGESAVVSAVYVNILPWREIEEQDVES